MNCYTPIPAFCNFFSPVLATLLVKHIDEKDVNWMMWKTNSNTRKFRKNSELQVRIELTTLRVLVRMLYQLSYEATH